MDYISPDFPKRFDRKTSNVGPVHRAPRSEHPEHAPRESEIELAIRTAEGPYVSMLSLRGLLSLYPTVLVIDSSSTMIQVGVLRQNSEPVWETSPEEAGVGVFMAAERALSRATAILDGVDAFVFCEGPGSVLGIRTAAVAIRTWNVVRARSVFSFSSLELVARFELPTRPGSFSVIADARRDTWHSVSVTQPHEVSPLLRLKPSELTAPLLMPKTFRHWSPLPTGVQLVSYAVAEMLERLPDEPLFRDAPEPDAFMHEQPAYQTWTPQVHRAPVP